MSADGGTMEGVSAPGAAQAHLPNGAGREAIAGSAAALSSHPSAASVPEQALHSQGQDSGRGQSQEPDHDAGQQPWSYSGEPSRAQSMEVDGEPDTQAHVPRPGSGRRPKYVTPVDELDNSDVESAQVRAPFLSLCQQSPPRMLRVCRMSLCAPFEHWGICGQV